MEDAKPPEDTRLADPNSLFTKPHKEPPNAPNLSPVRRVASPKKTTARARLEDIVKHFSVPEDPVAKFKKILKGTKR